VRVGFLLVDVLFDELLRPLESTCSFLAFTLQGLLGLDFVFDCRLISLPLLHDVRKHVLLPEYDLEGTLTRSSLLI